MAGRTFHVVTQRRWMVDELTEALVPAGWQVRGHYGLWALPAGVGVDPDQVLWAPGAFAARMMLVDGAPLRLSAPGPQWMPRLWVASIAREVELFTVAEAKADVREGFWKLAEAKWDRFPAAWRTAGQLAADLAVADLPDASLLQFTRRDLRPTVREFRAVVLAGQVTTISCYLGPRGCSRDDVNFTEPNDVAARTALRLAIINAELIEQEAPAGPAYALDITYAGEVIEANPIWCSAWYGCDLVAFAEAVAAGQGAGVPDEFVWRPDPVLVRMAVRTSASARGGP